MKHVVRLLALGAILAGAGASAQTAAFDMKGTWKGTGEAIVDGHGTHHPAGSTAKPAGPYRLRELHFTYKIDGQEGKRFWGTVSSEHEANQRMIGSLSADGKWIYIAGKDGILDGTVVDSDTIQMCYRQVSVAVAIVACNEMKRQK